MPPSKFPRVHRLARWATLAVVLGNTALALELLRFGAPALFVVPLAAVAGVFVGSCLAFEGMWRGMIHAGFRVGP